MATFGWYFRRFAVFPFVFLPWLCAPFAPAIGEFFTSVGCVEIPMPREPLGPCYSWGMGIGYALNDGDWAALIVLGFAWIAPILFLWFWAETAIAGFSSPSGRFQQSPNGMLDYDIARAAALHRSQIPFSAAARDF